VEVNFESAFPTFRKPGKFFRGEEDKRKKLINGEF